MPKICTKRLNQPKELAQIGEKSQFTKFNAFCISSSVTSRLGYFVSNEKMTSKLNH